MQIAVMDGKGYQALIESKRESYDEELEGPCMLTLNGHVSPRLHLFNSWKDVIPLHVAATHVFEMRVACVLEHDSRRGCSGMTGAAMGRPMDLLHASGRLKFHTKSLEDACDEMSCLLCRTSRCWRPGVLGS